jgi:hypothetical protein
MLTSLMILLGAILLAGPAHATPILIVDASGHWQGAHDVTVNGNDYNLAFAAGTCAAVFVICDQNHFAFTTSVSALAAEFQIDQMAFTGGFENNPQLIANGDVSPGNPTIAIATPYAVDASGSVATWVTFFHETGAPDLQNDPFSATTNLSVWAVWTPVPEPSPIALLALGSVAVEIARRKVRRTAA